MSRDIYVDARSLAEWFPLEVTVDLRASALNIKAKERLPVQDLLERENLYHNEPMSSYQEEAATQGQPHTVPYSFLDLPMVDLYLDLDQ